MEERLHGEEEIKYYKGYDVRNLKATDSSKTVPRNSHTYFRKGDKLRLVI